jgi:hypothetical protein
MRHLKPYLVVTSALLGLAAGLTGTNAAILIHRHGIARPAVVRPAPRANPSPVLTTKRGAR